MNILHHLGTTYEFGISFQREKYFDLEIFVDVDYASKATDRRSVFGGIVMRGGAAVN